MKWFSLDSKCDLCHKSGPSVIAINHGDKKIHMCSKQWNLWLDDLFGADSDHPYEHLYGVYPEACEDSSDLNSNNS